MNAAESPWRGRTQAVIRYLADLLWVPYTVRNSVPAPAVPWHHAAADWRKSGWERLHDYVIIEISPARITVEFNCRYPSFFFADNFPRLLGLGDIRLSP